jgi:hypothetical protein
MTYQEMESVFENISKEYSKKLISGNPQQINSQFHLLGASELSKALDEFKEVNNDAELIKNAEKSRETYFNKISERIAIKIKRQQ